MDDHTPEYATQVHMQRTSPWQALPAAAPSAAPAGLCRYSRCRDLSIATNNTHKARVTLYRLYYLCYW